jgi:hypothetical protein
MGSPKMRIVDSDFKASWYALDMFIVHIIIITNDLFEVYYLMSFLLFIPISKLSHFTLFTVFKQLGIDLINPSLDEGTHYKFGDSLY